MGKKAIPANSEDLSVERLRELWRIRADSQEPPSIESLDAALKSRSMLRRLDAALWIAKFECNPRIAALHRPFLRRAAKVLGEATNPDGALSVAVCLEVCGELMEYMYEKPEVGPLTPAEEAAKLAYVKDRVAALGSGEITREEFAKNFVPRSKRPVN